MHLIKSIPKYSFRNKIPEKFSDRVPIIIFFLNTSQDVGQIAKSVGHLEKFTGTGQSGQRGQFAETPG